MSTGKYRAPRADLRAARVRLGLNQEQLAAAAGLSRASLVGFERGTTAAYDSTWDAIQTALEVRGIVFHNSDKPGFYFDKEKAVIPT